MNNWQVLISALMIHDLQSTIYSCRKFRSKRNFAEVGTEYTCSQVINYVYVYTRKVQLKSKTSSTKAPARLQHEISVTFAIAQQCSSDTYVSLSFHSCKEN